ncbi:carboxypeptidase-like regulatory domain-containing protein, partial [Dokdonella sp.]|uniref:carboxypeptidase-like regulatory domain-containing protein n=1 Tax=Dokdonella sp. TaxID=2291710 RepID=UPI002602FD4A
MSCRRALNGVLALLVTVLAGAGPAAAQEKSGPVTSPPSPVEDVVHHRKGWEPKEDEEFEIDADEPGAYSDTVRLTDRSAKARPVLGTMQRSGAMGTADLRQLLPGVPFKRDRERRENEGPTPHPVLLPGTEGTASAVEQEPGGGILRATPQPAAPAPAPIASFDGLDSTFAQGYPPDNTGDVGPAHYIEAINSSIGIFDKATGTRLVGLSLDSFMGQGNFGNLCDNNNYGDPVVLYDSFEDRWIITDFAFSTDTSGNVTSNVYQCFAVSRTGDPVSGGWYFYSDMTSDALPDYPKFGVWTDGIYRSANNFGPGTNGGSFVGSRAWAYNKAQMYAGAATVQIVQFDNPDASDFTLLPSNARLQTGTPPTGRPNYFVSLSQYLNSQNVYAFKVDWDRPTLSTFALVGQPLASNSWANASPPNNPTPKNALDALGIRAMMQNQYTNIGGVESLWNSHTVRRASTGSNVPRWYQINVTGGSVAANDVQSTNWDPDAANTNYRWMPSLAVDRAGNMAIGYSLSNSTTNPKIMYAGRLAGDPVNTFSQTEQTLIAGTGAQTGNCGSSACARWGDYTTMTLDPDGCTFWYVNEYYTSNDLKFRTRIGAFRYPSCTPVGSGGTISGTVTGNPGGTPIAGASVQLGSRVATTDASGFYSFTVPAGTYPVEIASAAGYNAVSATSLVVADGGSTTQDFSLSAAPAGACYTDTTQSDFQTGALTNIDLGSSPGDALLTSTSRLLSAKQETDSGSGSTFTNTTWSAQTFTATASGQLTGADIGMFCNNCSGANPDITVSVRAVSGNLPTGADLATATLPGFNDGGVGGFKSVTFATPVSITSGTQYALVVRSVSLRGSGSYIYSVSNTSGANPYSGGRNATSTNSGTSWSGQTRSLVFRAYVTVPRTYSASGDLVSNAKDANPAPGYTSTWNTLNWTGATPAGTTLRFQAAGSNLPTGPFAFVGPGGSAATYFNSGDSLGQFNGKRYLKYRAYLATSNTANSPVLSDVSLCSTNQPPAPVATKLAFTQQPPASSSANAPFAVKVAVQDAGGNVVTGDTSAVTLALSGGTAGASLVGTATVNAVGGIATFPNLSVDLAGSAYKLVASDGSLAGATSDPFDIVPNTYTVGGTVSGLSGAVSLKLDGTNPTTTQTQAFTSNGAFAFTTSLSHGSGWTVSVASQPVG